MKGSHLYTDLRLTTLSDPKRGQPSWTIEEYKRNSGEKGKQFTALELQVQQSEQFVPVPTQSFAHLPTHTFSLHLSTVNKGIFYSFLFIIESHLFWTHRWCATHWATLVLAKRCCFFCLGREHGKLTWTTLRTVVLKVGVWGCKRKGFGPMNINLILVLPRWWNFMIYKLIPFVGITVFEVLLSVKFQRVKVWRGGGLSNSHIDKREGLIENPWATVTQSCGGRK